MSRLRLKCGGKPKRKKALFGEAIMAAATLASAGMQVAATNTAAKLQADAAIKNAETQKQGLLAQNENNNQLQQEQLAFTRQQNQENRRMQQDIQTTLQMLAGQQNANAFNERNKAMAKYGKRKRTKLRSVNSFQPSYGGANLPFTVTDGGSVVPIDTDINGYGLYEIIGNDHEHYHKARGGKAKTGVGIKFANGEVVEGEGNQNTNQGELMYVTPDDALFISKHSIGGFNPTKAVLAGVDPRQAFAMQELAKDINGLNDDGSKAKCGGRKKLKATSGLRMPIVINTNNPFTNINDIATGIAVASSPVGEMNRVRLKCGGKRRKAAFGDYLGAIINTGGNLLGAGLTTIGNMWTANKLANANNRASEILADAYGRLQTVDPNIISKDDFYGGNSIAAIADPRINVAPELEAVRRNVAAETREVNRNTMSSAARQQKLSGINDRATFKNAQIMAQAENSLNQFRQTNAERITNISMDNANRRMQAGQLFNNARLSLAQYNNDIVNQRITGAAQVLADAATQNATIKGDALHNSFAGIGSALATSAQGFASTFDGIRNNEATLRNIGIGVDTENWVNYLATNPDRPNNRNEAYRRWDMYKDSSNAKLKEYARMLDKAYGFSGNINNNINDIVTPTMGDILPYIGIMS